MAWIYLAASADSPSPWNHGSDQSPTVRSTDTAKECCCRVWLMGDFLEVQYGTTLHRSMAPCFQLESTSSMVDSPARTLVLQHMAEAWKVSEVDLFSKRFAWSASYDQASCSWKTPLGFGLEGLRASSGDWPSSGMTRAGHAYQLPKLAPVTSDYDGGCLLPTPTKSRGGYNRGGGQGRAGPKREGLHSLATMGLLPGHPPGSLHPRWLEQAMGYPVDWTEQAPWAMQFARSKPEKRL